MSDQKVKRVYVRTPIFDPDPSPHPAIGIGVIIALLIGGSIVGLATNPDVLNNILYIINPELKEIEEEQQKTLRMVIILVGFIVLILGIFLVWKWRREEKYYERANRRNRKLFRRIPI